MKAYIHLPNSVGEDGFLTKTGLMPGGSAPFVLMPGDPGRSKTLSGYFRDSSFTAHRGTLFPYGHLLGLRTGCVCVVFSNMFRKPEEQGPNPYGDPTDPQFMPRRIEKAARIAMRAAERMEGLL